MGRGIAFGIYKNTSHAAVVADITVDARGDVKFMRLWCVHDCGLVINPDQVRAQCDGNLVWSIGMVLTDSLSTERGLVTAQTFADAPIPHLTDVPPIIVDLVQNDRPLFGCGRNRHRRQAGRHRQRGHRQKATALSSLGRGSAGMTKREPHQGTIDTTISDFADRNATLRQIKPPERNLRTGNEPSPLGHVGPSRKGQVVPSDRHANSAHRRC